MSTDTPDQQITMPVDPDAADNPVAFNQAVGDIEPRLVRRYTDLADRTARMLTLVENAFSTLATENRAEIYDGASHISLYTRSLFTYVRKANNETINNTTALQPDNDLLAALPTAGTFQFELNLLYSASTVADAKFAFVWPAGATASWNAIGLAAAATTLTGDATFSSTAVSGTSVAFGGIGVGTIVPIQIFGDIVMGGTAGNLQLQWAQQNLEATDITVHARSSMRLWRML